MHCNQPYQAKPLVRHRAFTLVEVLLALAITGLVGLSVATMLTATAYGTTNHRETRGLLVQSQTISARLNSAIRTAKEVLYPNASQTTSTDYIVVWIADDNDDSTKQNNEVQLIERNSGNNELRSYANPADTADFTNVAAFRTQALASYTSVRWSTGVSVLSFEATTSPTDTMLIGYTFTVTQNQTSHTSVGAATPRSD